MQKNILRDKISTDLESLLKQGRSMAIGESTFKENYESWYTAGCRILGFLVPERIEDFKGLYKAHDRKALSEITYSICDYLVDYQFPINLAGNRLLNHSLPGKAENKFKQQIAILVSCEAALDNSLYNLRTLLQADLFDSEIEAAIELKDKGFFRAAGVVLGVVIEQRLASMCLAKNIVIQKKDPTISDFNEALKTANIFTTEQWRFISRLADLRNICCHNKGVEPTEQNIKDLVDGTQRLVTEIF